MSADVDKSIRSIVDILQINNRLDDEAINMLTKHLSKFLVRQDYFNTTEKVLRDLSELKILDSVFESILKNNLEISGEIIDSLKGSKLAAEGLIEIFTSMPEPLQDQPVKIEIIPNRYQLFFELYQKVQTQPLSLDFFSHNLVIQTNHQNDLLNIGSILDKLEHTDQATQNNRRISYVFEQAQKYSQSIFDILDILNKYFLYFFEKKGYSVTIHEENNEIEGINYKCIHNNPTISSDEFEKVLKDLYQPFISAKHEFFKIALSIGKVLIEATRNILEQDRLIQGIARVLSELNKGQSVLDMEAVHIVCKNAEKGGVHIADALIKHGYLDYNRRNEILWKVVDVSIMEELQDISRLLSEQDHHQEANTLKNLLARLEEKPYLKELVLSTLSILQESDCLNHRILSRLVQDDHEVTQYICGLWLDFKERYGLLNNPATAENQLIALSEHVDVFNCLLNPTGEEAAATKMLFTQRPETFDHLIAICTKGKNEGRNAQEIALEIGEFLQNSRSTLSTEMPTGSNLA